MKITITHCRYAPKWETLQNLVREATNEPDGVLTRIDRVDGGCHYRGTGEYRLGFHRPNETNLPIELNVVAVG